MRLHSNFIVERTHCTRRPRPTFTWRGPESCITIRMTPASTVGELLRLMVRGGRLDSFRRCPRRFFQCQPSEIVQDRPRLRLWSRRVVDRFPSKSNDILGEVRDGFPELPVRVEYWDCLRSTGYNRAPGCERRFQRQDCGCSHLEDVGPRYFAGWGVAFFNTFCEVSHPTA